MNSPQPLHSGGWQTRYHVDDEYDASLTRSQLDAIEDSFEEQDSSMMVRRKSQGESVKVTQFARPPSSHGDSPVAFTFMKAKLPQMDFSRKLIQTSVATAQGATQETSVKTPQSFSPLGGSNDAKVTSSHFPLLTSTESSGTLDPPPPPINCQEIISAREKLVADPETSERHCPEAPEAPEVADAPKSLKSAPKPLKFPQEKSSNRQDQQNRQSRAKKTNFPRTSQKIPEPMISPLPNPRTSMSDEDLLSVLLLRQRAQQEQRDLLRANEAAKDQEIGDLKEVSHNLYQQLQHVQDQDKAKGMEISRLHAIVPRWEKRIQSLTKCLNTLSEDHRDLLNDSKQLKKMQEDAQAEKLGLVHMLKDVQETVRNDHRKHCATNKVLLEARHQIGVLEQKIKDQEIQSRADEDLLRVERSRGQKLEAEINKLTITYRELTTVLTCHRDTILEKLGKVLDIGIQAMGATQAQSQVELKTLVNQCVDMLQKIHTMKMVKPQDLGNLDNSIRAYAQSLSRSMDYCGRTSESTKELQQKCSTQVQQQLHDLTALINAGHVGAQQIMDLREAKATIRERLQATEIVLVETRQRALALESKEKSDLQRISSLQLEVAKLQRRESDSSQTMIRLQELNIFNSELKDQLAVSRQEAIDISRQLKETCEENSGLHQSVKNFEYQLNEARAESNKLVDERLAYERNFIAETEKLRQQLSQAANLEEARLESDFRNQIQQLRQLKTAAEDEAKESQRHLEMLKVEKDVVEGVASERLQALNELEAQRKHQAEESDILRTQLVAFNLDSEEKQKFLDEAKERLQLAITDLDIKEKKILSLTATKALNADENTNSKHDTGDRPRRSLNRSGRQVQFVVEGSQSVAFSEKSPAAAKVTSKVTKSSYFNHTESVAPPSSPIDELLGLFPPTPVLLMQGREGSKTPVTIIKKAVQDADGSNVSYMKHQKKSRASQLSPNYQRDEQAKAQVMGANQSGSQSKPSSPQSRRKRANSEKSQHHQPDPSSQQPAGVLRRPTTRPSRIDKRSALAAGHGAEQSGTNKKSRLAGNKDEGLGPMMSELRSPNGSRISAVRGRQVSKGNGRKTVGWL